jgi:hypothetical protein
MRNLEVDFFNEQRYFFAEIAKLRGKRKNTTMHSLRVPDLQVESYVTSNPAELKSILFDFHSKLGLNDPNNLAFNKLFYENIISRLNDINSTEAGLPFCEELVSFSEVKDCITLLENNKAQGLDLILNESLKYGGDPLVENLTNLFNSFWECEVTPSVWAKASVHLIHKGNNADPLAAESYRPISLTSNVMKVFERVILNRCTTHCDDSNVIPEEQAGFRTGRSCMEQVFIFRDILDSRRSLKRPTYASFLDMKQAFPSTWRDAVWHRLREAGISGKMFRVLQTLYMNNESSIITPYGLTDSFETDLGTRQGAVLSPLLFSLVISPLIKELRSHYLGVSLGPSILIPGLFYADDIVLFAESPAQLQTMLNIASNFFRNWRFTVNSKKSEIVVFGREFIDEAVLPNCVLSLSGNILKEVESYKYLGVVFQSNGKWDATLDSNIMKARHTLGELLQAGIGEDGLQVGHSSRLYQSCAMPQFLYGSEIFTMSATHLRSAVTQMNKAARNIFGKKGDCNVIFEALRGDLGWLSLRSELDLAKLRFYGFIHRCGETRLLQKSFLTGLKSLRIRRS